MNETYCKGDVSRQGEVLGMESQGMISGSALVNIVISILEERLNHMFIPVTIIVGSEPNTNGDRE